ncbi:glycosyltransferase family 2 protein [Acetobacter conturbans]|uniref:Glycosyltransferase n=1 Tax=Acetobacter conturbans TaxID=1737472 RepID=A0ABX0JY38_9PROT|nr:glycosyltransferase [Acetobacter conturbans]NHN88396.1 glycosyltransferase [Acetobacter conturbans]
MPSHRIDVLMTTYNGAQFLPQTLNSILNQTFKDFRLIIVDDGSTDNSPEILSDFCKKDSRIQVVRQENRGIVPALCNGLTLCEAPFLARHDADDISDPTRFERELAYLETHPDCVALSAQARYIDADSADLGVVTAVKDLNLACDDSLPAHEPYLLQPLLMARSEAVRSVGGYRHLTVSEDSDLCWRLQEIGRLHILPEVLGSYRRHANSITTTSVMRGRQIAIWSQLAALSAQRRRHGKPDITFSEDLMQKLNAESTLEGMMKVALPVCMTEERSWFSMAVCAKLLEVCYYRPYEPDRSDIIFIKKTINANKELYNSGKGDFLKRAMHAASSRLLIEGRIGDALSLTEWQRWPSLVPRTILRVVLSEETRVRIRRFLARSKKSNTNSGGL